MAEADENRDCNPGYVRQSIRDQFSSLKDDYNKSHQKQTLNKAKKELLMLENGRIIDEALQSGDLDDVFVGLDFLESHRKNTENYDGKEPEKIDELVKKYRKILQNYTNKDGSNILQMTILSELEKQAVPFSDKLPMATLSWLKKVTTDPTEQSAVIKKAIIHTNLKKNSSLHLSAKKRSKTFFVSLIEDYLEHDENLPEYLDQSNYQAITPLTMAVKQECVDEDQLIKILKLEQYSPDVLEKKVISQISESKTTLDLIISKGFMKVMRYLMSVAQCKDALKFRLNLPEFQKRLCDLPYPMGMYNLILTEAVTSEELRKELSGLITPKTSDTSRMHAVIFFNDEVGSESDASKVSTQLQNMSFSVQSLNYNQWDKGQLIKNLKSRFDRLAKDCSKLLLIGITHGEVGSVIDNDGERIKVAEIEAVIEKAQFSPYTYKTVIFDMCQDLVDEDSDQDEDNITVQTEDSQMRNDMTDESTTDESTTDESTMDEYTKQKSLGHRIMKVFSCSSGEQAIGETFLPQFCRLLEEAGDNPIDLFAVLIQTANKIKDDNENMDALIIYDSMPNSTSTADSIKTLAEQLNFKTHMIKFERWTYTAVRDEVITKLLLTQPECKKVLLIGIHDDQRQLPNAANTGTNISLDGMKCLMRKQWAYMPWTSYQDYRLQDDDVTPTSQENTHVLMMGFVPGVQLAEGSTKSIKELCCYLEQFRNHELYGSANLVGLFRVVNEICTSEKHNMRYQECGYQLKKPVNPRFEPPQNRKFMTAKAEKDPPKSTSTEADPKP